MEKFRKEFKDLLKRYHATVGFSVSDCSDTCGLYDECIVVCFDPMTNKEYTLAEGWWVDESDL